MNNCYTIEQGSEKLLKDSYLLIDTNVLIDSLLFNQEFGELLAKLKSLNCHLLANDTVRMEFLGGIKDKQLLTDRTKLLEKIAETIPAERYNWQSTDHQELLLAFSKQATKFSSVDFGLLLTLKKYARSSIYLMTRNHSDFSAKLLNREGYITLFGNKEVRTYSILSYK